MNYNEETNEPMVGRILDIQYHRNGVAGTGFNVVLFESLMDGEETPRLMVATVFPEECEGCISVLDVRMTAAENIRFGENSWRGDQFEAELRAAIKMVEECDDISYEKQVA